LTRKNTFAMANRERDYQSLGGTGFQRLKFGGDIFQVFSALPLGHHALGEV